MAGSRPNSIRRVLSSCSVRPKPASLGLKAIAAGYRVLFTTAATLIEKLTKANADGRLEDKLKLYTASRLLIVDEIGYLPIDRVGANPFFQLISRRYERGWRGIGRRAIHADAR